MVSLFAAAVFHIVKVFPHPAGFHNHHCSAPARGRKHFRPHESGYRWPVPHPVLHRIGDQIFVMGVKSRATAIRLISGISGNCRERCPAMDLNGFCGLFFHQLRIKKMKHNKKTRNSTTSPINHLKSNIPGRCVITGNRFIHQFYIQVNQYGGHQPGKGLSVRRLGRCWPRPRRWSSRTCRPRCRPGRARCASSASAPDGSPGARCCATCRSPSRPATGWR